MRFERIRKVLLDPQHLGRLITVHRATYIALNGEGACERRNRHVSIGKAKRYAVTEQEIVHQVIHVVLAKDDPAVIAIFPHSAPDWSPGWVGTAIARMISGGAIARPEEGVNEKRKSGSSIEPPLLFSNC
jgi:hypothetical protein